MFLCYDCTLEWFHRMTSFCIFKEICKGISGSAIFNNPAGAIHQTVTIVRFLNGSSYNLRVFPNRAYVERLCESIFKWRLWFQTKLTSTQSNYHYHLKYYCELLFQLTSFISLLFSIVFLGVGKMWGPWTPGPWTRCIFWWTGSTEGVHGPGVHVLYFPLLVRR